MEVLRSAPKPMVSRKNESIDEHRKTHGSSASRSRAFLATVINACSTFIASLAEVSK